MGKDRFFEPIKTTVIVIILVTALGIVIFQIMGNKTLEKEGQLIDGFVYDYIPGTYKSPGVTFKYYFIVNDKKHFTTSLPYHLTKGWAANNFVNKSFPVLVDTANIKNSQLLISRWVFDEFKVPFPDSLEWAQQYID